MAKTIPKFIGASVKRREDPALVTGSGNYTADIPLEGAVTMSFARSPYAHARVEGIDRTPALTVPGVIAVFTLDDLSTEARPSGDREADGGTFEKRLDRKVLLRANRVRHVGDPRPWWWRAAMPPPTAPDGSKSSTITELLSRLIGRSR
jgi:carbon-monoxide dehydrogenase large subunit